jgi:hypothetical protein
VPLRVLGARRKPPLRRFNYGQIVKVWRWFDHGQTVNAGRWFDHGQIATAGRGGLIMGKVQNTPETRADVHGNKV